MLLCQEPFVSGTRQDPCAFAANPEDCHYQKAQALLARLSPPQDALVEVAQESASVQVPNGESSESNDPNADQMAEELSSATTGSGLDVELAGDGGPLSEHEDLELKTMVLKQALDVLEGEAPASASLENATLQIEQQLEDIEPGAVNAFRTQHLAAAMNSNVKSPAPRLRAAVAARLLSGVEWESKGEVASALSKLENVALHGHKGIDPETYLCSIKSCGTFGCGTGADPANSECDPTGEKKCADGHGTCRAKRGRVLDGHFKIEIMNEPGHFLYLPDWDDEEQISAISPAKHKAGDPGPKGYWKVVLNADGTIMLYCEEFGPEYWLSIEEHAGKKLLAYRHFTSPVAISFTAHTNKEEDQLYLRDVPFKCYITDKGDGEFQPDSVLDKMAANLKFHPPLPDDVPMIADSARGMSVLAVILLCVALSL